MKAKKYRILFFALILAGLMTYGWMLTDRESMNVGAAGEDATTSAENKVKPVWVDYDALWLKVDANGNKNVYYSDKSMKIWYEAKSVAVTEGGQRQEYYYIDISWLSSTKESVINLKGDLNEEVVSITFPARDSKFKAKFDKATGEIVFENVSNKRVEFEWRKATSYTWTRVEIADAKDPTSPFRKEIEKLRISGASIYVRLPQTISEQEAAAAAEFNPGERQSKEIKINITKLATAPKVTIDGTKMLLNTKTTMEYSLDNGKSWKDMEAKMPISKIAPTLLFTHNSDGSVTSPSINSMNVLIRTKKTDKKPASKSFLLTIPAQRPGPSIGPVNGPTSVVPPTLDIAYYSDVSKFYMNFTKASKKEPYEYLVVKPGATTPDLTKGWKAVTSAKTISLSSKTAAEGSVIYVRKKTIKENTKTKTAFQLASTYTIIPVKYAPPTPTPAK